MARQPMGCGNALQGLARGMQASHPIAYRGRFLLLGLLAACGGEPALRASKPALRASKPVPHPAPPTSFAPPHLEWTELPALPSARANNAVAGVETARGVVLFSFLGIGAGKDHHAISRDAYRLTIGDGSQWAQTAAPPHPRGRLASLALTVQHRIYLIGGYTVDPDGHEVSVPDVDRFEPNTARYTPRAPMPIPVDDTVGGVWRDRYIVLVSGWSNTDNVAAVQLYDTQSDSWSQATPIIGAPVFGHGGAIAQDTIVYCGGAVVDPNQSPRYRAHEQCFTGSLDEHNIGVIDWQAIPHHPGPPRYRMACGPAAEFVVCAGGTDNPYNYDGVGYDKLPSTPLATVLAYHTRAGTWFDLGQAPVATMDHRSLAAVANDLFLIGGMAADQQVTARAWRMRWARSP